MFRSNHHFDFEGLLKVVKLRIKIKVKCLHNLHIVVEKTKSLFEVHQFTFKFT